MPKKRLPLLSLTLINLRHAAGLTQTDVAAKARISSAKVSGYERGDPPPTRQQVDELAALMGQSPLQVELAIVNAMLTLLDLPSRKTVVDPTEAQLCAVAKVLSLEVHEFTEVLAVRLLAEVLAFNAQKAREEAAVFWKLLKAQDPSARKAIIQRNPGFQHWGLCILLCDESEKKAADDAGEALELADLARFVAHLLRLGDSGEGFFVRLEGWAEALVANARRVAGDLDSAAKAFSRAWELWKEGSDEAHLLSESRLLDLEASLLRAQRRLEEALQRHAQALELARPDEVPSILVRKSVTLMIADECEDALACLIQAAPLLDRTTNPRLWWVLRHSQALILVRLGRAAEAEPMMAEVRGLAEQMRNSLDLVRAFYLAGMVDAGLGRTKAAIATLVQVCREFDALGYPFDYALVGLDLALLYRDESRWPAIRDLATRMVTIFQERRVHRETVAAVILFQEAAEREAVTIEQVRRLQKYLVQAQAQPGLRFEV